MSDRISIVEVGPRDGLQNEKQTIDIAAKVELVERLAAAGNKTVEAGAFVSPKWVPHGGVRRGYGARQAPARRFLSGADAEHERLRGRARRRRRYGRRLRRRLRKFFTEEHQLLHAFPFAIRRFQCDHGKEFPLAFALAVEAAGIRHRYIRPRRPRQNGKVERSHRIDHDEFWSRQRFVDFASAAGALRRWEHAYNHERFWLALKGRTPVEKLLAASDLPAA